MKYIIDAQGKKLGRVASEAAVYLMGKHDPSFLWHTKNTVSVEVVNASRLQIGNEKKRTKIYTRYTGYPGGLRKRTMDEVIRRRGYGEVVRRAVHGMLPANKLRKERIKKLIVKE